LSKTLNNDGSDWAKKVAASEKEKANGVMDLLKSDVVGKREEAVQKILAERGDQITALINLVIEKNDDKEWLNPQTSRNMAVQCLGEYRAVEAIPTLVKLLVPPPGFQLPTRDDRPFHSAPATRALIQIGYPCLPRVVEFLASMEDFEGVAASQGRLVIVSIVGVEHGEAVLKNAANTQKDDAKRRALQEHVKAFAIQFKEKREHEGSAGGGIPSGSP
jgi:hypothetical protein